MIEVLKCIEMYFSVHEKKNDVFGGVALYRLASNYRLLPWRHAAPNLRDQASIRNGNPLQN